MGMLFRGTSRAVLDEVFHAAGAYARVRKARGADKEDQAAAA